MGGFRLVLQASMVLVLLAPVFACSSGEALQANEQDFAEPARVPDPPPRYTHADTDSGIPLPDESDTELEPKLQIRCGGNQPYVCPLEDGSFRCSDRPCVPACDRVGCVGGEVCRPCEGGFRCLGADETC
jgi:hypothetical protein